VLIVDVRDVVSRLLEFSQKSTSVSSHELYAFGQFRSLKQLAEFLYSIQEVLCQCLLSLRSQCPIRQSSVSDLSVQLESVSIQSRKFSVSSRSIYGLSTSVLYGQVSANSVVSLRSQSRSTLGFSVRANSVSSHLEFVLLLHH
jgi:hypothetical protein